MVLVAATILPHVPAARKGAAGGAIFLGLGLGIAGSGTIIPLLLNVGLAQTWIGLGIVSVVLTAASWFAWPASQLVAVSHSTKSPARRSIHFSLSVKLLYAQYALLAAAAVPTMVFLVDFIARGLNRGTHLGSVYWAIYGLGAIAGPPLYGYLADRLGAELTIRTIALIMAVVLSSFYITDNLVALGVLTALIGTFAPGIVPLILARVHELVTHNATRQNVAWTRASTISAAAMAVAAYACSALFAVTGGNHRLLFLVGAVTLIAALLLSFAIRTDTKENIRTDGES